MKNKVVKLLLVLLVVIGIFFYQQATATKNNGNQQTINQSSNTDKEKNQQKKLDINGSYTSKEDVALYIHLYQKLPSNYITKKEAMDLGWDPAAGNLWDVAKGKSIGGDRFSNREKTLPSKKGIIYYECDIDYRGGRRNGLRIVYSNQGKIYYSNNHYESFKELY